MKPPSEVWQIIAPNGELWKAVTYDPVNFAALHQNYAVHRYVLAKPAPKRKSKCIVGPDCAICDTKKYPKRKRSK